MPSLAANAATRVAPALALIAQERRRILEELGQLVAIPSISTRPESAGDVRACAEWLAAHLAAMGMTHTQVIATGGHPIVISEWRDSEPKPALLIYGHYDVQPPEPLEPWLSPPFVATVRENRVYGRGTTDDKGQLFIHLKAMEACLRASASLPVHVRLVLEGEEEIGSPSLAAFLQGKKEWLRSDLAVISDTPFFAAGIPSICYGLRGTVYMEVEVTGPATDLHSGSHGGAVHNPIQALAEMIAQLHDARGRVAIPGFYDGVRPLSQKERNGFRALPWSDRKYAQELGVPRLHGEAGFTTLERLWARPTLECHGIGGGYTEAGSKTIIPARAAAKISMRIVPGQRPERIAQLFAKHVRRIAPSAVRVSVQCLHASAAALTPLESPGMEAAVAAMSAGFGRRPVMQREGGSIPVATHLKSLLGMDTVLLGFGLPDENAHAPNEFLDLGNFFGGMATAIHFYHELANTLHAKGD